jgi:PAS domain S-box-containing protein
MKTTAKIYLAISLGLVLLATLGALTYRSTRGFVRTYDDVEYTQAVLDDIDRLYAEVLEAELLADHFQATADPRFARALRVEARHIARTEASLERLLGDFPESRPILEAAVERVDARLALLTSEARDAEDANREVRSQEQVERLIDALRAVESRRLERRTEAANASAAHTLFLVSVVTVLGIMAGFLAIRFIARELEERRRASLAREKLLRRVEALSSRNELLLQSAGEGIYAIDEKGIATMVNPAALRMTGFLAEEFVGRVAHALIHHSTAEGKRYEVSACRIREAMVRGEPVHCSDEVFFRKDGSRFPVEFTSAPIVEEGATVGAVVTFRDISAAREIERLKDEFVSIVSHELRTPLTSIRGSLGLLSAGLFGQLDEKGRRMLEISLTNTDRLVRLINDILDLERMESGTIRMVTRRCEVRSLIAQALENVRPVADKAGVVLKEESEVLVAQADEDRIIQTLTNLMANAVKFSPAGGEVRVSAKADGPRILFEVRDAGRGIPDDKLDLIFKRFQQVDASDAREKGGTGLGLAICMTIVHQHGGEIWVESEVGVGSRFFFTLPPAAEDPLVLVCDSSLPAGLLKRGIKCREVEPGGDVSAAVATHRPAAVFVNLHALRGWSPPPLSSTGDVPVVFFNGSSAPGSKDSPLFEAVMRSLAPREDAPRALVVEDDRDLAEVLGAMLERHGAQVGVVATEREAIAEIERTHPALLVLDLTLAEGNGFEVVDFLRSHQKFHDVRLLVYTGLEVGPEDRARLQVGESEVFMKSRTSPEELERHIVELLQKILPVGAG